MSNTTEVNLVNHEIAADNKAYANQSRNTTLYHRACRVIPGGVNHQYRYYPPHPIYTTRAKGAHKWDADGKRYIDYKMGSASVMLGHCHPDIVDAIINQTQLTQFTSDCHELEIEWAEQVNALIPSAELTRFTASGSESTMLAVRLGRAYSRRPGLLRISGHYHGWHDHFLKGASPADEDPHSMGVPEEISALVTVAPADITQVENALEDQRIGTVIVEASGANYGSVPLPDGFLPALRKLTEESGRVLIFDEIITGFRWSPGGRQARDGVVPDLTTLAKILTGGLPGGAVAGHADIMSMIDPRKELEGLRPAVSHKGTFNASPIVAAAAIAALKHIATGEPLVHADAMAERLRTGFREILDRRSVSGAVYGESSTFHVWIGECSGTVEGLSAAEIRGLPAEVVNGLRGGLLERGVDLMSYISGVTSAAHRPEDIDETLDAFDATVAGLTRASIIKAG